MMTPATAGGATNSFWLDPFSSFSLSINPSLLGATSVLPDPKCKVEKKSLPQLTKYARAIYISCDFSSMVVLANVTDRIPHCPTFGA